MSLNLKHIAEGWAKHLGLVQAPEDQKILAKERVQICIHCPYAKEQWLTKFIDDKLEKDILGSGIGCSICGCPVNQKALVPSEKCPMDNW